MNTNSKKLAGKVALVTGGSRSIGASIAKRLAADGASVAITYSSSPAKADEVVRAIESTGGKALSIKADAADPNAVRAAVTKTVEKFGGIDILVNNAGVAAFAPIDKFSMEDFEKIFAVNVRGVFVATQEAVRHMRDGGRIINIGGVNSERVPFTGGSVIAMSKAAVAGLLAAWLAILARAVSRSATSTRPVDTDMNPPTAIGAAPCRTSRSGVTVTRMKSPVCRVSRERSGLHHRRGFAH
jgi:3-oxoacyl-[acyl-carrier protein] reductase